MRLKPLTLFALGALGCVCLRAQTQIHYGVKLGFGTSRIQNDFGRNYFDSYKNSFALSGQFGVYCLVPMTEKLKLSSELLFIPIRGKETLNYQAGENNMLYDLKTSTKTTLSLLSMPVYASYNLWGNTHLLAGVQPSFVLSEKAKIHDTSSAANESFDYKYEHDDLYLHSFDISPRLGLAYVLNDAVALECSYYHSLASLSKAKDREYKIQQFTMGIRYSLNGKKSL